MTPAAKSFTERTIQAFSGLLALATDRLAVAVELAGKDDLEGAVAELRQAAALAHASADGATNLACTLDAERVRP